MQQDLSFAYLLVPLVSRLSIPQESMVEIELQRQLNREDELQILSAFQEEHRCHESAPDRGQHWN